MTIYEVTAGSSQDDAQLRRLERAIELLQTHIGPTGGNDGGILGVMPVLARYETFLSRPA